MANEKRTEWHFVETDVPAPAADAIGSALVDLGSIGVAQRDLDPRTVRLVAYFYDKAGKLFKTFYTKKIKTIDGSPRIVEVQMVNKSNGHSTELVLDNLKPRKDLPDSDFTPTALEHG